MCRLCARRKVAAGWALLRREVPMKLTACAVLLLLGAAMLTGCAESRTYKSYSDEVGSWSYPKKVGITVKDWFLDLTDIASLELGTGETIGIDIQPTKIFEIGALTGDVFKIGARERAVGFWREVRTEGGFSWFYYRDQRFEPTLGTKALFERPRLFKGFPIRYNKPYHWMDLGAEVGVIFFQAGAHVSPKHALDFVFTTIMLPMNLIIKPPLDAMGAHLPELDICDDDTAAAVRKKYELELVKYPERFEPVETFNDIFLKY